MKILLMDDDTDFCTLVQMNSKALNIEWTIVHNSIQAIHKIQEQDFDMALLDYRIIDGSCENVVRAINLHKREMAVVILSGFLSSLIIDMLSEIREAIFFVRKPDSLNPEFFAHLFSPFRSFKKTE